jgi:hypothetical protein
MCFFGGGGGGLRKVVDPVGQITKNAPTPVRLLGLVPATPTNPLPVLPKSAAQKLLGE